MDQTIDNLVISVTASADSAARSLDRLGNSVRSMGGSARSAGGDMSTLGNETKKVDSTIQRTGRDASTSGKQIKRAGKDMEDAGKSAKKGTAGLSDFLSALKRIAFYRAVRSVIRSITDAFKTGITNMYQWSKVMDGTFAKSMDRIATSTLYLKNSLGAMLAPIINSLAPVIEWIIDRIVEAINWINKLFSALSGSQTYTVAKKVATTWGDASDKATSSAKKAADDIKRTILGFDEINKLEKQNTSSGSGGSGSGNPGTNYSDMFETRQLDGWMLSLAKAIEKTKAGWAVLLGSIIAGFELIKAAIKKVFNLGKEWLKSLAGKTVDVAVSLVRAGWETITEWALSFGSAVVDLAVTIKTTALSLWAGLKLAWLRVPNKLLEVGAAINNTALSLWAGLKLEWLRIKEKVLSAEVIISTTAQKLWNDVLDIWDSIKDKVLKIIIQPEIAPVTKPSESTNTSWQGAGVTGDLPGDENPLLISQLGKMFSNINLPNVNFAGLKKNVHDISGKLLPVLLLAVGVGAAAAGMPALGGQGANAMILADQDKLKGQVQKLTNNPAKLAYAAKKPQSNKNTIRFDPTFGMSDAAKQKAQAFSDAIVKSWNTITSVASNTVTNTKAAVDDLVSNFDKGKDNALGITWEPVGENVTKTLRTGLGNTWWTVTGEMVKDMNSLQSTANSYSLTATGMMLDNTLSQGINSNAYQAFKAIADVVWGMFHKAEEVPWITFGSEIPQDVSNGVNNNKSWAVQAALDVGWAMYNAMNGVSFWDIGYNIVADVYNGFVNNTSWLANTLANTAKGLFNIMSGKTAVIATSTTTSRKTTVSNAKKPTKSAKAKSLGGILSNGIWTDIPQFANGTLSAGSLFWAGEAGPEIVGHVGGRTEVLNKSQLASAIYSAVQSAMAPAASNFAAAASSMRNPDAGQADYETLLMYIQQGNDATMRQNELLRQQNDYLRSINDKEWTAELTTAAVQRSLNRSNLRAGTTVVPVG